jgi:hypothetical protein
MYVIKRLLQTTAEELYKNLKDNNVKVIIAKNISLCNTSGSAATASLSIRNSTESFETGAILFEYALAAKETLILNTERIIQVDDVIEAYSGTIDVIALSIDVDGDEGRFTPVV